MTTRLMPLMFVATVLACSSGCAKSYWIQETLVPVDVTGTWVGSSNGPSGDSTASFEARFELKQQGSKVAGLFRVFGPAGLAALWPDVPSGPIEGTVAGDVFQFSQADGSIVGEMTVRGDKMTGYLQASATFPMSLRRVSSSSRPAPQP